MWRHVDIVLTNVSEECIAYIFRVEKNKKSVAPAHTGSLAYFFFSSSLKMETIHFSETSVNTISTRCHIPEDCFVHGYRHEILISYNYDFISDTILEKMRKTMRNLSQVSQPLDQDLNLEASTDRMCDGHKIQ
jgi:hypothetical protein